MICCFFEMIRRKCVGLRLDEGWNHEGIRNQWGASLYFIIEACIPSHGNLLSLPSLAFRIKCFTDDRLESGIANFLGYWHEPAVPSDVSTPRRGNLSDLVKDRKVFECKSMQPEASNPKSEAVIL